MATWTTPTNFAAEEVVTSTKLNEQVIQDLLYLYDGLSWTDFTPTWTNVTLGTGSSVYGRYRRIDDVVEFQAGFKLGTGGSSSGVISMTGPLTTEANSGWSFGPGALVVFAQDDDAADRWRSTAACSPNSTTWVVRIADDGSGNGWGGTIPFTWDDGDELHVSGTITVQ